MKIIFWKKNFFEVINLLKKADSNKKVENYKKL